MLRFLCRILTRACDLPVLSSGYCPPGTETPIECGANLVTDGTGWSSESDCACETSYFKQPNATGTGFTCKQCDGDKVDCSRPGAKVAKAYYLLKQPIFDEGNEDMDLRSVPELRGNQQHWV